MRGQPPTKSMDEHFFKAGAVGKIFRRNSLGEDRELSPVDKVKKLD